MPAPTEAGAPASGSPIPGTSAFLADLKFSYGAQYAIACGFHRGEVTWTAARRDALGHVWTPHHDRIESLIRADMGRLPVAAQFLGADRLAERFMGRHPGWACVCDGEGFVAWRGGEERRAPGLVDLGRLLDGLVTA